MRGTRPHLMSVDPVHAELATELGLDAAIHPAWLAALSPEMARAMLAQVRTARAERRAALQGAIDEAMQHVPRLLRGALRKVLFA